MKFNLAINFISKLLETCHFMFKNSVPTSEKTHRIFVRPTKIRPLIVLRN